MKTLIRNLAIIFLFFVTLGGLHAQSIWIANNNPGASGGPNVTFTLQAAIDSANAGGGDIIHVVPSSSSYGAVTIGAKSVSIFGIGTNVTKEGAPRSTTGEIILANGANNIVLSGLRVETRITIANGNGFFVEGILIENCYVTGDIAFNPTGFSSPIPSMGNMTIRSNIIGSGTAGNDRIALSTNGGVASNIAITNNIIVMSTVATEAGIDMNNNLGAIITNNLFYSSGSATSYAFERINSATIKNNIFYGTQPFGATTTANNTFSNNLSFAANSNVFPTGTNTLIANQEGVDPLFINVPLAGGTSWSFANDAHITAGSSPAEGAGDDALDIGLTGGNIPFNFKGTNLPLIQQVNIPSAIIQGSTLPTTIKAIGN